MKDQDICVHPPCDRPRGKRRGYCVGHYNRWRAGDDMDRPWRGEPMTCRVDGCGAPARGTVIGYCGAHYERYRKYGDTSTVHKPGWKAGTRWSTDVGYREMHKRMDRVFGTAATYACVDCGQRAANWSYTGDDPEARVGFNGCAYSVYPEYYTPRCLVCHRAHDRSAR